MKRFLLIVALLAMAVLASGPAQAQQLSRTSIGPKLGFYVDIGKFMVGAVGDFALTSNLYLEPGFEIVFGIPSTTRLIGDLNARYAFLVQGQTFQPWVLGGFGIRSDNYTFANASTSSTAFRLNLGGGITFNTRSDLQPWAGLKIYLLGKDDSDVLLQGGVNFFL
jgi:hypothetical protein